MNRTQSNFLMLVGFLITFGAVGGIENDAPLLDCMFMACLGLGIAYCGVLGMKVLDNQGK
jgi:hypothetical protein